MSKKPWVWTTQKELAAQKLAQGNLDEQQVANLVGVCRETVRGWKRKSPEFRSRIAEHVQAARETLQQESIGDLQLRSRALNRLLDAMYQAVEKIPSGKLLAINENPITAINLLLRLQNAVDTLERRTQNLDAEYADINFPELEDLPPQVAQRVGEFLEQAEPRQAHLHHLPSTNASAVCGEDDQLQTA